ncbi:hypothetical protein K438DRAFT_1955419 [Mycena galopus ATCC 62051]|nr:hypothetical protein K438DRAFT_1955419 [Mycena galopus ATCC 62051]
MLSLPCRRARSVVSPHPKPCRLVARAAQPCRPRPKLCLPLRLSRVTRAGPAASLTPPKPCCPAQSRVALSPAPAQPCRPRLRLPSHVAMPKMVSPPPVLAHARAPK